MPATARSAGRGPLAGAVPATALPPREAGLHGVGHDSIEVMDSRSVPPGRFDACERRACDAVSATRLSTLLADLRWRGLVHDVTDGLEARLATNEPIRAYNGFDPTFRSLHVGHLVPVYGLMRLQRAGGQPVALVGGATGLIGDPSGRSSERPLLDRPAVQANVHAIRDQLARFLDFAPGPTQALVVNNLDWLGEVRLLDFLRDVGKHFTVPVHARQGLGPGAAGEGPLLHRVQLHAPPGGRLRPPPAARTASSCSAAAPTSGATSRPAWS